jgi:hypothetical protein
MVTQGLQEGPRFFDSVSIGSYVGSIMGIPTIVLSGTAVLSKAATIQVGIAGSRTGSDATITFYQTFVTTPQVFIQNSTVGVATTTTATVPIGSISTTGFYALSTGSPINFSWIAVG